MTLLRGEGVDRPIVEHLRRAGFDVLYVAEMEPGIPDEAVLQRANQANALLITADKDFGQLVFRQRRLSRGVVPLRLAGLTEQEKSSAVLSVLTAHEHELVGAFSVITPKRVRIRPGPGPQVQLRVSADAGPNRSARREASAARHR